MLAFSKKGMLSDSKLNQIGRSSEIWISSNAKNN